MPTTKPGARPTPTGARRANEPVRAETGAALWTTAPLVASVAVLTRDGRQLASQTARAKEGDDGAHRAELAELLKRSRSGEHIELMLDCVPFLQHPEQPNRNFLRFRPGGLRALGKSGVSSVFLRDHRQRDLDARGGTVITSRMDRDSDGIYRLHQSIRLHEPWAVQKALTGSIDRFSIGWHPTGPVICSLCRTPVLDECWHWPGDVVEGKGKNQRVTIEWIFHAAELIETSAVCVPAVLGTTVDDLRAVLATCHKPARTTPPGRKEPMSYNRVKALLGLAADADEDAVAAAIEAAQASAENAQAALVAERAAHEALKASLAQQTEDAFIQSGVECGKLRPGSKFEAALRKLHAIDPEAAREQLDAAPVITPVGALRQSDKPPPPEDGPGELTHQQLANAGITDPAAYYAKYGRSTAHGTD